MRALTPFWLSCLMRGIVIDDYGHLLLALIRSASPDILILSPNLPGAVRVAVSALGLLSPSIVRVGSDFLLELLGHDSLHPSAPPSPQANALRSVMTAEGANITRAALTGLVVDWEDASAAVTLCRQLAERFAVEFMRWVPEALESIPIKALAEADRARFLAELNGRVRFLLLTEKVADDLHRAMQHGNLNEVRTAVMNLDRASRKTKQRALLDRRRAALEDL